MSPPEAPAAARTAPIETDKHWRVVLVTGLSGAGKTTALKALEDAGYEVVDNLPLSLLYALVRGSAERRRSIAVGVDIRTRDFGVEPVMAELHRLLDASGVPGAIPEAVAVTLLFLDCDDDVIARRFTETRRRHPLALDRSPLDGIRAERQLLAPLRERADIVVDTSLITANDLRGRLSEQFGLGAEAAGMSVLVTSFAYRQGLPRDADLVFDVRFLANPHYVDDLRGLTGQDDRVAAYVAADPDFVPFTDRLDSLLDLALPRYEREGKSYLTIAFGCSGGRHRSVFLAERLAVRLRDRGLRVRVLHRELDRAETQPRQAKVSA